MCPAWPFLILMSPKLLTILAKNLRNQATTNLFSSTTNTILARDYG